MNSQGYTKDNIHKGNTKIVAGGIDVDGLIRIGDQSAGGDGYVLPAVKGTEGQVLTMNADNTSSFEDAGGGVGTSRVLQNLFNMTNPSVIFNPSTFRPLYTNSNGSDNITTADIAVGGSVRFRTKGYLYNGSLGSTALGQFRLNIGVPNSSATFDFYSNNGLFIRDVGMSAGDPNVGRGWWEINITVTKIDASNNCTISVSGLYNCVASTGVTSDTFDIQFYDDPTTFTTRLPNNSSSNTVSPIPFWNTLPSTFKLELAWKQTAFDANAIATEYTIDYCNVDTQVLTTTTAPATDHNTLANLNVGDPHQLYAFLSGRSGGQLLSGGITSANFLTLKAHRFGLNNIIIKDLNTEFVKNIDMTQNQINDVSLITNTTAPLGLVGSSGTSAVVIDPDPSNSFNVLGQSDIKLQSNTDVILQSSTGFVDLNSNITRVNVGGITKLQVDASETTSTNNINMGDNEIQNLGKITSSADLTLTPTNNVVCSTDLDMSNNNINNANTITASNNLTLNAGNNNGIIIENAPNDTIIFQKSTNHNNNVLDNVGVGVITNIVNCQSINGLTPVGGLFAGTSDSLNVASTTAEISILPLTFVGVGFGVPPNGFSVGDTFRLELSGPFNSNNNDTLTIRLKGGPTSTTLLSTLVVPLNASSGSVFQLSVLFQIRAIGGAGVADIISDADLTYNQSGAGGSFVGEQSLSQNNTTFDTTLANVLDVTAQFSSTSANNNMTTRVSKLQKTF